MCYLKLWVRFFCGLLCDVVCGVCVVACGSFVLSVCVFFVCG